jgi:hypothetical protein
MTNDSFMTIEEVAAKLRVKKSWVYTHADDLGGYRLGKYLRFSWPRVLECLEGRNLLNKMRTKTLTNPGPDATNRSEREGRVNHREDTRW